ncbi:hypothetical protein SteCoe_8359 [Stentor coeruleus]|uniref:Uncharacterized protein n=1 Tax=Stentor coeruleus TaxID=5963 RepID=A0A1R2CKB6_9CILI|nr:hypothetical protein SteCoe_8359 [Stentor coeruleus]
MLINMSSLTYHAEHLAWQQRVQQEKSRATNFYKTQVESPSYDQSAIENKPIFPNATVDEKAINYRALKHTLGYTFGGTRPIKHALYDSPEIRSSSKSPEKLRRQVREASQGPSPCLLQLEKELRETRQKCGSGRSIENSLAYIQKLEEKLIQERKKRVKAESRLKN